jgi:hypothetical protein
MKRKENETTELARFVSLSEYTSEQQKGPRWRA